MGNQSLGILLFIAACGNAMGHERNEMDVVILSRLQFALTTAFHYIFPPISIGLGVVLVIMEGMYLKTKNPLYEQMTKFWVKIFGLVFAMGVASGIVLEFQFGTNWATYSRFVGDIFGSVLAAEGIFAFFLESGFLAILLFGWDKVSPTMHFISTICVSVGSLFSAVWIIIANSWMQTPVGYKIAENGARAEITDFWAVVFNPSSMIRLSHVLSAALITGASLVLSVSAYYLLKKRHEDFAKKSFKICLVVALVGSLLQLATGDLSAKVVAKYQPAKFAAMEGHYAESAPAPLYIFGWVNEKEERVDFGLGIPGMSSLMLHGDSTKPVPGLKSFKPEDRPKRVNWIFQSYHLMVAIGMGLIGLMMAGIFFQYKGTLEKQRFLLWIFVFAVIAPQLANMLGWIVAELGRQPWIVYNLLRTSDAVSRSVEASQVLASLIMFSLIYALLFSLFIFLLDSKIKQGPQNFNSDGGQQRA